MSTWKPQNFHDVGLLAGVLSCVLSFTGSLMIILAYWLVPKVRKPARRLLFWLSVADIATTIVYMVSIIACRECDQCSDTFQLILTVSGIFWPVSSALWTDCIGLYIYAAMTMKMRIIHTKRLFTIFHIVSWCIPLILGVIIIGVYYHRLDCDGSTECKPIQFTSNYTGGWCWIDGVALQMMTKIVIEYISYAILLFIHFATCRRLQRMQRSKEKEKDVLSGDLMSSNEVMRRHRISSSHKQSKIKLLFIRLKLIPLVFLITRTPAILRVILKQCDLIHTHGDLNLDDVLMVGQAFFEPLQGFCNAVLFLCCVQEIRTAIFEEQLNESSTVQQNEHLYFSASYVPEPTMTFNPKKLPSMKTMTECGKTRSYFDSAITQTHTHSHSPSYTSSSMFAVRSDKY